DIISFTNLSNNAVSYKWYFGDGDSSLLSDPTHFYFDEGTYSISLIAYNINGCNDTTSYNIEIKNELFFAPNSFTPGEDGKNDEWAFVGLPDLDSYELIIFNRWGEEIFRSTNPTENWNGKYKGVFVQTGIYTWKLTSKTIEGKTTLYQGHINVLKSLK
ncbi:MAG: gliding motility-associated C-terminal domain-containing protein, partial [Flavobacteriales bacterium]